MFLKDIILYHKHSFSGTEINQLLLPEVYLTIALVGLHDEAANQVREDTMSLVTSRFYWPGMGLTLRNMLEIAPGASGERLKERQQPN